MRPVVLVHHGVGAVTDAEDPDRLVVSPAHLESQVRLLLRLGYRFVTAEAADRARAGAPHRGADLRRRLARRAHRGRAAARAARGARASFYVWRGCGGRSTRWSPARRAS